MLTIFNVVGKALSKVGFWTKQHSPEILIGTGIVAGAAGTFLACMATKKTIEDLEETKEEIKTIETNKEEKQDEYPDEEVKNDKTKVYLKATGRVIRNYAPAMGVMTLSVVSILAGSGILKKRNVALATGLAASIGEFNEYRKNLIEKFGDDGERIDKELRYGVKEIETKEETVDENGKKKTKKVKARALPEKINCDGYKRVYDSRNPYWDNDPAYNEMFLRARQNYWNDKLRVDGHVFLNDVLKSLGFPTTRTGHDVGWIYDANSNESDGYIDFGVYDIDMDKSGPNHTYMIEFNVDGGIYDRVDWPDQE